MIDRVVVWWATTEIDIEAHDDVDNVCLLKFKKGATYHHHLFILQSAARLLSTQKKAIKRLPIILHIHFSQCNSLIMACDTSKRGGRRFSFITKESNINCLVCSFYCWEFNMTFDFYLSTHIYTQINYRRFSLVISIKAMQNCQSDFLISENFLENFQFEGKNLHLK